jgi:WD40 repeat protein/energy-coupling factor transporter ATP-binding protein EcfA2
MDANPFPGLRSFEEDEAHLFFGREGQSDELLARLRRNRFLAIVGTSGSGKSSLIRAGLLPSLHGGFMADGAASWQVACFRPGSDPIGNLARSLAELFGSADETGILVTLRRSGLGLLEAVRQARLPAGQSLLVVVDQFEELFRFKQTVDAERSGDASAFIKLLLEATAQIEIPLSVVLTMRSDYLGDCAQFRDLPERLNDAQYLIPRMTRDQRREAVTGPVLVGGGRIAPRLLNRLLNDVGDNPDQLPILQHALMRTWELWTRGGGGEIDFEQYEAVGGMTTALSRHADEAYEELDPRSRQIAESLFKSLTEKGPDNREIRRPARLIELAAIAQASTEEVRAVIETFRREGRSFLMPRSGVPLEDDTVIDISHESLIRGWQRLKAWVDEEAQSAQIYRRVADAAARHAEGHAALWRDPDLAQALRWRAEHRPTQAWGERYALGCERALAFLEDSRRENLAALQKSEREGKIRRLVIPLAAAVLFAAILAGYGLWQKHKAREALRQSYLSSAASARRESEPLKAAHFSSRYLEIGRDETLLESSAFNAQSGSAALLAAIVPKAEAESSDDRVAFSADGQRFATWSPQGALQLWDAVQGRPVGARRALAGLASIVFSDDGKLLLGVGKDGSARLWRSRDGSPMAAPLRDGQGPLRGAALSPDGALALLWRDDGLAAAPASVLYYGAQARPSIAHLWRTSDGSRLPLPADRLGGDQPIDGAVFSADGQKLLVWNGNTARLWTLGAGAAEPRLLAQEGAIDGAAFSRDGRHILTWGFDHAARLWPTTGRSPAALPLGHEGAVLGGAFSEDGAKILTWSLDGSVRLWGLDGSPVIPPIRHRDAVLGAELSKDGGSVLIWSGDGAARLWDAADGSLQAELFHGDSLTAAKLVAEDRAVTWGSRDGARVWNLSPEPKVRRARAVPAGPRVPAPEGRALSHTSDLLLTWRGGVVQLWEGPGGTAALPAIRQDEPVRGAVFSRNDSLILVWDSDCVRLWNTADGSPAGPPLRPEGETVHASFSPGEDLLLTQGADGTVQSWDIDADYDFPREHWPLLVEVATGTAVDEKTGRVKGLSADEWKEKRAVYREVAAEHLRSCRHQKANLYRRQKGLW